jgi:hypothetical protein
MILTEAHKEQIRVMRQKDNYLRIKDFFKKTYKIILTGWDIRRICKKNKEKQGKVIHKLSNCRDCFHLKTRLIKKREDIEQFLRENNFIVSNKSIFVSNKSIFNHFKKHHKVQLFYCEYFRTKCKFYIIPQTIANLTVIDCSTFDNMDEG